MRRCGKGVRRRTQGGSLTHDPPPKPGRRADNPRPAGSKQTALARHHGSVWPADAETLIAYQRRLADMSPPPWAPPEGQVAVAACWVCFPRGVTGRGSARDPAWAAAVLTKAGEVIEQRGCTGVAGAPYTPGLLALRVGRLMGEAVQRLANAPDALLVDGTGRDHPRRAGLALHLGAELGLPTVGVTHRPLLADGDVPADRRGASSSLRIGDEVVACWLRTKAGTRPLLVHPGWRIDLATAIDLVLDVSRRWRTPEPLRCARRAARRARAQDESMPRA
jgi:deoxyribonuclease V